MALFFTICFYRTVSGPIVVETHNEERHKHQNTPDIFGSFSLSLDAKACAEFLANNNSPVQGHPCSRPSSQGENLYKWNGVYTNVEALYRNAMSVW